MASKRIKKCVKEDRGSGPRYWMAIGTLAAYSAAGGGKLALAQSNKATDPTSRSGSRVESLPVRRYEIAPGPLAGTLKDYERAAHVRILVPDEFLNINSPGVSGSYTTEEALKHLLSNTGVTYQFNRDGSIALKLGSVMTSVEVTAVAPTLNSSLTKYQSAPLDTPQTIDTVSRKTMEQQGTATLRDALRNVAGISLAAGEGGAQGDNLTIRGFTARNDLFIDGMRDFGSY